MTLDADMLRRASEECSVFLDGSVRERWTEPIPEMSWNVAETVAHMAQALLWYSSDLAAGPDELSSVEVRGRPDRNTHRADEDGQERVTRARRCGCDHRG